MKAFVESGEGMAVILLCAVESNPLSEITLLKGGQPVASSPPAGGDHPGQSGHISPAPNALRLELREASEEDEGEYECRARSPLGSARASLPLRVQGESGFAAGGGTRGWGPPERAGVGIEGYGPNQCCCWAAASRGEDRERRGADGRARRCCCPLGWAPTPRAHPAEGGPWLRSRERLFPAAAEEGKPRAGGGQRSLSPAVRVVVRPSAEVPEGTDVTLTCRDVGAHPGTLYTWYKNGRWLAEGLDASLVLPAARPTDAGAYACQLGKGLRGRRAPPAALRVLCE